MGSIFAITGTQNAGAAQSVIDVTGSDVVIPSLFYINFSCIASPADATIQAVLKHFTANGTGDGVTPRPLGAADRVAVATAQENHTTEPTYTGGALLEIGMNQRSLFQMYSREGAEFVAKKNADNGIGLQIVGVSSGTPEMAATFHYTE